MTRRMPVSRFSGRTLPAILESVAREHADRVFIRWIHSGSPAGPPRELTFAAFTVGVSRGAAFLRGAGVGVGDRVLFLAENSPEWQFLALGAQHLRAEPAALFASLAAEQVQAIARRVRPRVIFVVDQGPLGEARPGGRRARRRRGSVPSSAASRWSLTIWPAASRGTCSAPRSARAPRRSRRRARPRSRRPSGRRIPSCSSSPAAPPAGRRGSACRSAPSSRPSTAARARCGTTARRPRRPLPPLRARRRATTSSSWPSRRGTASPWSRRKEDIDPGARAPARPTSSRCRWSTSGSGSPRRRSSPRCPAPLAAPRRRRRWRPRLASASTARARSRDRPARRHRGPARGRRASAARLGGRVRALFSGGAPAAPALFRFFEGLGHPLRRALRHDRDRRADLRPTCSTGRARPGGRGSSPPTTRSASPTDGELQLRGPLLLSGYLEPEDGAGGLHRRRLLPHRRPRPRIDADGFAPHRRAARRHLLVLSTGKKLAPEPVELAIAATPPFQGAVLLGEGRPFVAAAVFVARDELARLAPAGRDAAEALLPRARAALAASPTSSGRSGCWSSRARRRITRS